MTENMRLYHIYHAPGSHPRVSVCRKPCGPLGIDIDHLSLPGPVVPLALLQNMMPVLSGSCL